MDVESSTVSSTVSRWRTPLPSAVLCGLVCVGACDCGDPLGALVPDIAVAPSALDWGTVRVGVPVRDTVAIGNRGTGALDVASVTVEPADAGFTVVSVPRRVQPQQAQDVELELVAPLAGDYAAELVILSNDDDTPELRVPLTAVGGVARLVVAPDPVDLGLVNQGPGGSRAVTLSNEGFDVLTLTSASFAEDVGFDVDASALPVALAPGESAVVTVSLQPAAEMLVGLDEAELIDRLIIDASTGPAEVRVRATVNLAPVAIAAERDTRQTTVKVGAGTPVFIDGSETADPEGDDFALQWSMAERPVGSIAGVVGQGQPSVRVTPDLVGRFVVRLRATDVHGAFSEADVVILPRDLSVVLTWDADGGAACRAFDEAACAAFDPDERALRCCGQSDLDLHLIAPGGTLGDYGACPGTCSDIALCAEESDANVDTCRSTGLDCAFANRFPEWGTRGRSDDPRLDIDDVRGNGPEIISLNNPRDGIYTVVVHYCLDRIDEPTVATVAIFDEGELLATTAPQALAEGDAWIAAVLVRSAGAWQVIAQPDVFERVVPADLCSR